MKMLACVSCPEGESRHREPYTHEGAEAMADHLVDVHDISPRPTLPWALLKAPSPREDIVDECAEVMHDAYERAAVGAGWKTNPKSRKPWDEVPEENRVTMRAAVTALLEHLNRG